MEAKLAVSSIAWQQNQESSVAQLMRKHKVRQVEIAPTKVWSDLVRENPLLVPPSDVREYIKFWNDYGITPIAMQSMLFFKA
jgi:hypothetical protein